MGDPVEFVCYAYQQNITNIDGFRCNLEVWAATLYDYNLGYICMGLLGLIIVISIFGGIQGNYRWFILNQAMWDLLVSHMYTCSNYTYDYVRPRPPCFYEFKNYSFLRGFDLTTLKLSIIVSINYNPYSALLLLTASRFVALNFPQLYAKLTKKRRIAWTIAIFNLVIIFCDINNVFSMLKLHRMYYTYEQCELELNVTYSGNEYDTRCTDRLDYKADFLYRLYDILFNAFTVLMYLKPAICLSLSSIAAFVIMFRVLKQASFQLKHNRNDFLNSLRIAAVLFLQTLLNLFVFVLDFIRKIEAILPIYFGIYLFTSITYDPSQNYDGWLDFRLPLWLDGESGLTDPVPRQMFTQLRVFLECIVTLFIMTGYREAIRDAFKYGYSVLLNPRKTWRKMTTNFTQTSVTTLVHVITS